MNLPTYFDDFLRDIRLKDHHVKDCQTGHKTLRDRLAADTTLGSIIVSVFLQGSYRRATAIIPRKDKRSDVDIIVVTRLSSSMEPGDAIAQFVPFVEKHYKGKYEIQGRSIGIKLSYVDLDLVITAAPSEQDEQFLKSASVMTDLSLEETPDWPEVKGAGVSHWPEAWHGVERAMPAWKTEPLLIPDREAKVWVPTHPLEQIRWTRDKNAACIGHYINVVKAIKWWRRMNSETLPAYPKGYPIEHLVGACCPDDIRSVAEGVTLTFEAIASEYAWHAAQQVTPDLPDHGVPAHNVFKRVSGEDFAAFHAAVVKAAEIARRAYDEEDLRESARTWKDLFGDKFPDPPPGKTGGDAGTREGGFSARTQPTRVDPGRFA